MTSGGLEAAPRTRVIVVDDHAFIRAQVTDILNATPDIEVVGECDDGSGASELATRTKPDVVVMDFRMPGMSGIDATKQLVLEQPQVRVLILTGSLSDQLVGRAREAGAVGVLGKGSDPEGLVTAVRRVAAGGTAWPGAPADPTTA